MSLRQPAVRVFASEYNDSTMETREEGQYSPNFVVTPLGARINRLFLVGVLLEVSEVGNPDEPFTVARVSDPSGSTFRVSAGSKKADLAAKLKAIQAPAFIAVVGKSDLYNPEPGVFRLSVDPEVVQKVDDAARMQWILETARATKERIDAVNEARKMEEPRKEELMALGFGESLSLGAVEALQNYPSIDLAKYARAVADALSFILPEYRSAEETVPAPARPAPVEVPPSGSKVERTIKEIIARHTKENPDGVPWDILVSEAKKKGLSELDVEEGYVSLRDKGELEEPSIGLLLLTK